MSHDLFEAIERTWPPAQTKQIDGFTIRDGAGGGKRVSAATARESWTDAQIDEAEGAMRALGQTPLFQLRPEDRALDTALKARGYTVVDPVTIWSADPQSLATEIPRVMVFEIWKPLAIQRDIWAAGGIGPARLAVMDRAAAPKTSLLGRMKNRAAGTGFCAIHDGIAMVHALEIAEPWRRLGLGRWLVIGAAEWAARHGAHRICALCTDANGPANALYAGLGFQEAGRYHYRIKEEATAT